jgi:hypothetical protein
MACHLREFKTKGLLVILHIELIFKKLLLMNLHALFKLLLIDYALNLQRLVING